MKEIKFTDEELNMLQNVFPYLEDKCDWERVRDTHLFKCRVLLDEEKLNFDIISSIIEKLYT
jgi:hypothetical protein